MRRFALPLVLLLLPLAPRALQAQQCRILCAPVFVAQPGVVIANAINAPEVAPGVETESSTEFLFRVTTVIPTEIPRTTLVALVQWTPFAQVESYTTNSPAFVYGPVFSLFNVGPLSTTFDVLGLYAPTVGGEEQDYEHQLLLEFDVGLSLGTLLGASAPGYLRSASLYGFLAQPVTDLPEDYRGDTVYTPLLLFGLTLPIAPLP